MVFSSKKTINLREHQKQQAPTMTEAKGKQLAGWRLAFLWSYALLVIIMVDNGISVL